MKKSIYISIENEEVKYSGSLYIEPYEKNNIVVIVFGNFYHENTPSTAEDLFILYIKYGVNTYKYLDGVGTLFIIDKNKERVYCFTDIFNGNIPIYILKNKDKITISSSIENIKKNENIEMIFDNDGVKKFIRKGFIVGKRTLLKNVNKIPPKHYVIINIANSRISYKRMYKLFNFVKKKNVTYESYDNAVDTISKSVVRDNYCLPLTCGFDTNYLFYHIRKNENREKTINVLCIGGELGWNEINDTRKVISHYYGVDLKTSIVNDSTLEMFPKIVSILEGAIYEHGIFLQYELAKLANNNNFNRIILGECADQILNYNICHPITNEYYRIKYILKNAYKRIVKGIETIPYKDFYEMGAYKIIKKSGLMLNYFGIETEYPYIRRKFIEEAINVVIRNDLNKTYHKKAVSHYLSSEVARMLVKKPGTTELRTLFIGDIKYEDIVEYAKSSNFYRNRIFDDKIYEMNYYMKLTYLNIFDELYIKNSKDYLNQDGSIKNLSAFLKNDKIIN